MKSIFLFIPLVFVLFFISFSSHGQNKENQNRLDSIKTTLDNLNWQEIDSLGRQAQENLNYKEAEVYFKKNIEIAKLDSLLANSLERLGNLYYLERKHDKAMTVFLKTKELQEKLGKQRIEYALACGNIALIKVAKGNYDEAEKLQLEAKEIREKIAGKISIEYAKSCTDLAIIYYYKGQYDKAEPLYIQAKDIRKEVFGEKHTEYAIACGNLATIYIRQGLYNKAESLSLIAKNIYEEAVGKKHPNYTGFLGNLAILYYYQGKYNEAEPLFLEAKQLKEELTGTENQDYIRSCNNLAVLYEKQKDYQKAEELLIEVREKYKKLFGKNHFTYALACNSLGNIYKKKEEYKKSEPFYKEAKQIRKKILGKNHDDYVLSTFDLADLYATQKLYQKARPLYNESLQQKKERISIVFPTLSEKEKQNYFYNTEYFFDGFTDFAVQFYPKNKKISGDLFNQQLFTKGIIFSSTQKMKEQILNSKDSVLINQYEEWKIKKKNYIALQQKPIEQRDSTINLIKVASQINELEREISKKSRTFESNSNQKKYAWQDVQSSISENEVVVEIIRLAKKIFIKKSKTQFI